MGYQFYFGGTSLLILVGVAMDTVAQIEAQLVMRNYEGSSAAEADCADAGLKQIVRFRIADAVQRTSSI